MVDLTSCKGWESAKPVLRPNSIIIFWFRFHRMLKGLDHNHCNQVGAHISCSEERRPALTPTMAIVNIVNNVDSDRNFRDITISFWGLNKLGAHISCSQACRSLGSHWHRPRLLAPPGSDSERTQGNEGTQLGSLRAADSLQPPTPDAMSRLWGCCLWPESRRWRAAAAAGGTAAGGRGCSRAEQPKLGASLENQATSRDHYGGGWYHHSYAMHQSFNGYYDVIYVLAFYQNTIGWTQTGCQSCKAKWKYHLCILTLVKFLWCSC